MNTLKGQLDDIIARNDLSKTEFYKAWMSGELTLDSLKIYASEYGNFIDTITEGWATVGNQHYAQEEIEHVALWRRFAKALDTDLNPNIQLAEVADLCKLSHTLFATKLEALGALYAFEIQSPLTSKDKIEGLVNYGLKGNEDAEAYFKEHLHNEHETDELMVRMNELPLEDRAVALAACEQLSKALCVALDAIYAKQNA